MIIFIENNVPVASMPSLLPDLQVRQFNEMNKHRTRIDLVRWKNFKFYDFKAFVNETIWPSASFQFSCSFRPVVCEA
jgi:hypothetical protein